jgi:hypothetical protein
MGISWMPKSTVPATLAGVIYTEAKSKPGYEEYEQYGLYIQTTAILAIIFCEPTGSFLIDLLAKKLLTQDKAGQIALKDIDNTTSGEISKQEANGNKVLP